VARALCSAAGAAVSSQSAIFDGIHLGHQEILRDAVQRATNSGDVATALTFEPAPLKVLRPEIAPKRLSTNEQRLDWFRVVGLESAVVQPFTLELSHLTPRNSSNKSSLGICESAQSW